MVPVQLAHDMHFLGAEGGLSNSPRDYDLLTGTVTMRAGCNMQQGATSFCRATLGVHPLPHPVHATAAQASSSSSKAQQMEASDNQMVVTTTDGQVFAVSLADVEVRGQTLDAERSPAEQRAKWVSSRSASEVLRLESKSDNCSHSSDSTADSTADNDALQHLTFDVLDCRMDHKP